MPDLRPVFSIAGALLAILAVAMLVPIALDLAIGNPDWQAFAAAAAVTLFVGVALMLATRDAGWRGFGLRQGFLIANLSWVLVALFGALPFVFANPGLGFADAVFESMSGITTTGATVMQGLDETAPGLLIWRAILNWLGGIGIVVMALAVLPVLQVGGMQLFRVESYAAEQVLPRIAQIGAGVAVVYVVLTALGAIALWALGMTPFDAVAHAMSAISTGGFSTHDASIAVYGSRGIEAALALLMLIGAMPFVVFLRAATGDPLAMLRDGQVRWLFGLLAGATLLIAVWLAAGHYADGGEALWTSLFTTISFLTGTGFLIKDPTSWGGFPTALLLLLMFVGGAAGSTASGVKIFRVQIFVSIALAQLRRLTQPHGVFFAYFNRRPVPDEISDQIMGFFFLYGLAYVVLAAGLGFMGLDFTTALSAAASAVANVGPGLGDPLIAVGNFSDLPDGAKWWLTAGMLLGRLELVTVFVLLTRSFWRG
jgi:trk system potassium uptake protein TrkH